MVTHVIGARKPRTLGVYTPCGNVPATPVALPATSAGGYALLSKNFASVQGYAAQRTANGTLYAVCATLAQAQALQRSKFSTMLPGTQKRISWVTIVAWG